MAADQFLTLAIGAARALRDLHALGIIHRDIKPQNLVVDRAHGPGAAGRSGSGHLAAARVGRRHAEPDRRDAGVHVPGTDRAHEPRRRSARRPLLAGPDLLRDADRCPALRAGRSAGMDPLPRRPGSPPGGRGDARRAAMLSLIVDRLLAKSPEDRYQSSAGLLADLERCQRAMAGHGDASNPFSPGERDVSDRWLLPQHLYGREPEARGPAARAFERVTRAGVRRWRWWRASPASASPPWSTSSPAHGARPRRVPVREVRGATARRSPTPPSCRRCATSSSTS